MHLSFTVEWSMGGCLNCYEHFGVGDPLDLWVSGHPFAFFVPSVSDNPQNSNQPKCVRGSSVPDCYLPRG